MERRAFVRSAGATLVLVAGGRVWRAWAQGVAEIGDGPEYEPWRTWREDARHGPLALVRAAIISSNAYNSQPWLFKVSAGQIELYADVRRNLGAFDPYLRELHFSLGCALENLLLAAGAEGYGSTLDVPSVPLTADTGAAEPQLVARVALTPGNPVSNELYAAIPHRHTNRNPFDAARPVPAAFVDALARAGALDSDVKLFLFPGDAERARLADLIASATTTLFQDPAVGQSTRHWFRRTALEMRERRDGVLIDATARETLLSYTSMMLTGRLFGLIAVRDRYDRAQTIRAGRVWQRAHLLATARGLAARPANGAVEQIDHERHQQHDPAAAAALAQVTGDPRWQPTFMFYMGYATVPAPASARRGVKDVVV
jgi:nitroreductase